MALKTAHSPFTVEWDDGAMFIFSFDDAGTKLFCGFPHQVVSVASLSGTQTQVSAILQQINQAQVQVTADPATWIETVKTGARGSSTTQTVSYDDSITSNYTTTLLSGSPPAPTLGQNFTLQLLYSIAG
jgi:hypothetical protein